jgi:hypothetical protein
VIFLATKINVSTVLVSYPKTVKAASSLFHPFISFVDDEEARQLSLFRIQNALT